MILVWNAEVQFIHKDRAAIEKYSRYETLLPPLSYVGFFIIIIKLIKLYFHCIHNVLLYITLKCSLKTLLGLLLLSFHLTFMRVVGRKK